MNAKIFLIIILAISIMVTSVSASEIIKIYPNATEMGTVSTSYPYCNTTTDRVKDYNSAREIIKYNLSSVTNRTILTAKANFVVVSYVSNIALGMSRCNYGLGCNIGYPSCATNEPVFETSNSAGVTSNLSGTAPFLVSINITNAIQTDISEGHLGAVYRMTVAYPYSVFPEAVIATSRHGTPSYLPFLELNVTDNFTCYVSSGAFTEFCTGAGGTCQAGDKIESTIAFSGYCPSTVYVQTDAKSNDASCYIQHNYTMAGIFSTCTSSPCAFNWTIPSITTECQGKTVLYNVTALWADGFPPSATLLNSVLYPASIGNFTFLNASSGCSVGYTNCTGTCVNISSDNNNCGGCGNVCSNTTSCQVGACIPLCTGSCGDWGNCTGSMFSPVKQRYCTDTCGDYIEETTCSPSEIRFFEPTSYATNDTLGQLEGFRQEYVDPIARFAPIFIIILAIFLFVGIIVNAVRHKHS
jgi:hypothetical protein